MKENNITEVVERIRLIMKQFDLNQTQFAQRIDIRQPNLSAILKGERVCGDGVINKIVLSFDINKDWLLTGEGEMLNGNGNNQEFKTYFKQEHPNVMVPLVHIDSVGGVYSNNEIMPSEQYIEGFVPFPDARPDDRAIFQSGDSMSPTIPPGSILQIRKVEDWREYLGYGNVYVLWLKDNRRITKLVKKYAPDPRNYVLCCSYNPNADEEELPRAFIVEVWKVVNVLINNGW